MLCQALKGMLGLDEVSIDSDFFGDYGAHSLLMARFCARIRQLEPTAQVAMRDVYANPTVRRLARTLDAARPVAVPAPSRLPDHRPSDFAYYACGAAQMISYVVFAALAIAAGAAALDWMYDAVDSPILLYGRALVVAAVWFFGHNRARRRGEMAAHRARARAGDPALEPALISASGRPRLIVRSAPVNAFVGTPLFNAYLRLLGARIGRNAVVGSPVVPVTADLFRVGEDAVVSRSAHLPGYSAFGNRIHTGRIEIGRNGFVGEQTVLDIGSSIGDFGQLGHSSSLQTGQRIPAGKRYHGSPAEETTTDFRLMDDTSITPLRRWAFTALRLAFVLCVATALTEAVFVYVFAVLTGGEDTPAGTAWDAAMALLPASAGFALARRSPSR